MYNTKTAPLLARSEIPWPKLQQRFLAVLSCEEHRTKTVKEICQLAGFASTQAWYRALQDERFADLVYTLGIIKRKHITSKLSKVQQRLLEVLQREENRHKPITEICRLAGCTYSAWYWALANDQFVRAMEALGVSYRRNIRIPHLEVVPATNVEEDLARDVWDMRRLKHEYPKHRSPSKYEVVFSWIVNPLLREQIKCYFRQRLTRWEAVCFCQ